jgi:4-amino-4-deoxy-L-arabinose transferase-like glycosyltransferase
MIDLIRQHRRFFLLFTLAAVALRLLFIFKFPVTEGDTLVYGDIAKNWLDHHVFGMTINGQPEPTLIRLPGYPAFLAVCFTLFGREHYNAVRFVQLLMDVAACLLVADLSRRLVGNRAALIAFALAAVCPFTANYVALPLAETPSIFFTVLAFWFAMRGLEESRAEALQPRAVRHWIGCGLATGAGILMRPDNGIVLPVIAGYVAAHVLRNFKADSRNQQSAFEKAGLAVALIGIFALGPLIPWTVRNWRVFHVFQPLAARYANNPDEDPHLGFQQWVKTWMGEYVSVVEIYWHVTGEQVNPSLLPSRAFDSAEERQATQDAFATYNETNSLPPELDNQLAQLARERRQRKPLRYYVWLPAARIADMWLRPRTEMLGIMERWWEYCVDPIDFSKALAYGTLNLLYVAAALWGAFSRSKAVRYAGMLIGFVVLRSLFLGTLENPEPRYTLEMFPVVFVFAAVALTGRTRPRTRLSA